MKACDPMGVISVEPGAEAGCHVCISKSCRDKCADTLPLPLTTCAKDVEGCYARELCTEQVLQQQEMMPHKDPSVIVAACLTAYTAKQLLHH